jgi:hypothetical protein
MENITREEKQILIDSLYHCINYGQRQFDLLTDDEKTFWKTYLQEMEDLRMKLIGDLLSVPIPIDQELKNEAVINFAFS